MRFTQQMHEQILHSSSLVGPAWCLQEGSPPPPLEGGDPLGFPYCDHLNILGTDPDRVLEARLVVQKAFAAQGSSMHEETPAESVAVCLGATVDGKSGQVVPTPRRRGRLAAALRWLSRYPRVCGREIERLVGHVIFVFLGNRLALSVLRHAYDFTQDSYGTRQKLWPSVAEVIAALAGLLPLIRSRMRGERSGTIWAVDACESGFAVSRKVAGAQAARDIGRWGERWRYRHTLVEEWRPRDRTLGLLDALPEPPSPKIWRAPSSSF